MKLVFVHNSKTAGVSIVETLEHLPEFYNYGHRPLKLLSTRIATEDVITFTVVRNPFSRVWSQYNYYRTKRDAIAERVSFEEFVLTYESYYTLHDNAFRTCFEMISIDGEVAIDYLLKFETLIEDWKEFSNKFNLPTTLQVVNTSAKPSIDKKTLYTPEMRTHIENIFKKDFQEFEYSYKSFIN